MCGHPTFPSTVISMKDVDKIQHISMHHFVATVLTYLLFILPLGITLLTKIWFLVSPGQKLVQLVRKRREARLEVWKEHQLPLTTGDNLCVLIYTR